MIPVLTRDMLRREIERFIGGSLSRGALAAWAFDQFYAAEEERIVYESSYEGVVDDVLDVLMWGDSPPFVLDAEAARQLIHRLAAGQPANYRR